MNDSAHGDDGHHRRKFFWIGVFALFTAAFTVSLRAAVSADLKAVTGLLWGSSLLAMIGTGDRT